MFRTAGGMIAAPAPFASPGRRPVGLGITLALHVLLAALFLLRQPERLPAPSAHWIEMIRIAPASRVPAAPSPPVPVRTPRRTVHARAQPLPFSQPAQPSAPVEPRAEAAVSELLFPDAAPAPPVTFELARGAAGSADKEMRKEFPERALLRTKPLSTQQKLERGIAASVAAPKFYEAPRVTAIQDQGVGWGRRIDKVQTAFGTYCITYESNHGGDGRDVFKDALRPKVRNCPREK